MIEKTEQVSGADDKVLAMARISILKSLLISLVEMEVLEKRKIDGLLCDA